MEARLDAPDVVIVGAGVVGAAVAYELAPRHQRVPLLAQPALAGPGAPPWRLGGPSWLGTAGGAVPGGGGGGCAGAGTGGAAAPGRETRPGGPHPRRAPGEGAAPADGPAPRRGGEPDGVGAGNGDRRSRARGPPGRRGR